MRPISLGLRLWHWRPCSMRVRLRNKTRKISLPPKSGRRVLPVITQRAQTRNAEASKPNAAVWVLACENGTYRVTLVPNLAAQVEPVNESGQEGSSSR